MKPEDKSHQSIDPAVLRTSRRRTLKSFGVMIAAAAGGYGSWRWLMSCPEADGIPWPFRKALGFNEKLSNAIFRQSSRMDQLAAGAATSPPRLNTHIGVDESVDAAEYRLNLVGTSAGSVSLSLDHLRALPRVDQTSRLCCVEGWNTWGNWSGFRMADLVARYPVPAGTRYVGMSTADGGYTVGLDFASATHTQTLLVDRIDGKPLTLAHGFPLRLVIPTKYGIKNIKQVARIEFTSIRPGDYWAEQGYDWFAGL